MEGAGLSTYFWPNLSVLILLHDSPHSSHGGAVHGGLRDHPVLRLPPVLGRQRALVALGRDPQHTLFPKRDVRQVRPLLILPFDHFVLLKQDGPPSPPVPEVREGHVLPLLRDDLHVLGVKLDGDLPHDEADAQGDHELFHILRLHHLPRAAEVGEVASGLGRLPPFLLARRRALSLAVLARRGLLETRAMQRVVHALPRVFLQHGRGAVLAEVEIGDRPAQNMGLRVGKHLAAGGRDQVPVRLHSQKDDPSRAELHGTQPTAQHFVHAGLAGVLHHFFQALVKGIHQHFRRQSRKLNLDPDGSGHGRRRLDQVREQRVGLVLQALPREMGVLAAKGGFELRAVHVNADRVHIDGQERHALVSDAQPRQQLHVLRVAVVLVHDQRVLVLGSRLSRNPLLDLVAGGRRRARPFLLVFGVDRLKRRRGQRRLRLRRQGPRAAALHGELDLSRSPRGQHPREEGARQLNDKDEEVGQRPGDAGHGEDADGGANDRRGHDRERRQLIVVQDVAERVPKLAAFRAGAETRGGGHRGGLSAEGAASLRVARTWERRSAVGDARAGPRAPVGLRRLLRAPLGRAGELPTRSVGRGEAGAQRELVFKVVRPPAVGARTVALRRHARNAREAAPHRRTKASGVPPSSSVPFLPLSSLTLACNACNARGKPRKRRPKERGEISGLGAASPLLSNLLPPCRKERNSSGGGDGSMAAARLVRAPPQRRNL
mmetsp:Transcript_10136/g.25309  ORF Transcript_10136/g.25309 Transcript_10136/m.25309 type:complete len:718 (+) Transcript_10136:315-2468(+)